MRLLQVPDQRLQPFRTSAVLLASISEGQGTPREERICPQVHPGLSSRLICFASSLFRGPRSRRMAKSLVYAVAQMADGGEKELVALWLLSLEGGVARQLTAGQARDVSPQWSPDGRQIAFVSTRGEKPQIYLIAVDGGEARQLTALPQGVAGGPQWSPDGQQLAFTAGPPDPPDLAKPYRLTRHVYRFDELGYLDGAVQDLYVVAAAGGEPQRLTVDECSNVGPLWSPDGREILFHATMPPDSFRASLPRLRAIDLDGNARDLTGDWGYSQAASWLPDGGVVFCGQPYGRPIGTKNDLWVLGRQGGVPECRSADLPLHLGSGLQADMAVALGQMLRVLAAPDGKAAYVQVQDGGTVQVYRIGLDGPVDWAPVLNGERSCYPLDIGGEQLAVWRQHARQPAGALRRRP